MPAYASIKSTKLTGRTVATTSATVGIDASYDPDGPEQGQPGNMKWVDRSGGIQAGYPSLTLQVRKPTKDSRLTWVKARLSIPTMEVTAPTTVTGIQPAPKVAYSHQVVIQFFSPERGTEAERIEAFNRAAAFFFDTIASSDGSPTDSSASPLYVAAVKGEPVFAA